MTESWRAPAGRSALFFFAMGDMVTLPPPGRCIGLLFLLGLGGCIVSADRISGIEQRLIKLEASANEAESKNALLEGRIEELWSLFKAARTKLVKGGAENTVLLDEVMLHSQRTAGSIEGAQFHLDRQRRLVDQIIAFIDQKYGIVIMDIPPVATGGSDRSFLEQGREHLAAGRFREARAAFQRVLQENPIGEEAAEVEFGIGEAFFGEGDLEAARRAFQAFYKGHKSHPRMPEALLRIAEILEKQHVCKKAKAVYGLLLKGSKGTPQAVEGKARLANIKNRCKATSE